MYQADLIDVAEEERLLADIDGVDFGEVRFRGVVANRTVAHFGVDYDYGTGAVRATGPLPEWLTWLRDRCGELGGVDPERLVEALVTRYPPGAGIGWHRDAPGFGSRVIGVSLGAACRMRFRRTANAAGAEAYELPLPPRSGYVLGGAARWSWQHSIPPIKDLRHSITFRSLRTDG